MSFLTGLFFGEKVSSGYGIVFVSTSMFPFIILKYTCTNRYLSRVNDITVFRLYFIMSEPTEL